MLDYPLPLPRDTLYDSLGLEPQATMAEIHETKNRAIGELNDERGDIEKSLAPIFDAIPGLRETREEVRGHGRAHRQPGTDDGATRTRLAELERAADASFPEYRRLCKRLGEIAERVTELNLMPLLTPERRLAYDRQHPPLSIVKLAPCIPDSLEDNRVALTLLRIGLSSFLEDRGVPVFHPSDLTREDFSGDFEETAMLDGDES